MARELYEEMKLDKFKPITFGLYNMIDDDNFVQYLNTQYKNFYTKDDFEYYMFNLTDKEKFLLSIRNKEFLADIKKLQTLLLNDDTIKLYVDYTKLQILVIRLKK